MDEHYSVYAYEQKGGAIKLLSRSTSRILYDVDINVECPYTYLILLPILMQSVVLCCVEQYLSNGNRELFYELLSYYLDQIVMFYRVELDGVNVTVDCQWRGIPAGSFRWRSVEVFW